MNLFTQYYGNKSDPGKQQYIARLFSDGEKIDIECATREIAEEHILNSIFPQGEFDGAKLIVNGEVERAYNGT